MGEEQLHGKVGMENQVATDVNKVDASGDMGQSIRKAETLDYLTRDGVGAAQAALEAANPEFIVHKEADELYPQ